MKQKQFLVLFSAILLFIVGLANADELITSFESGEPVIWSGGTISTNHPSDGLRSYHVAENTTAYFDLGGADWSSYVHLKFDVYNPGEVMMIQTYAYDFSTNNRAWEYNVYAGSTTQHVRIDGLAYTFTSSGIGVSVDISNINRIGISLMSRHYYDSSTVGLYIDNIRISTDATEPYTAYPEDTEMVKPDGFYLPEFPGFEAGYHTWAIDPANYQLISPPDSGRLGTGRALKFQPLAQDQDISIWDSARTFTQTGTYTVDYWLKGPAGGLFDDHAQPSTIAMTGDWQHVQWEFTISADGTKRFVMEARNLNGVAAWLDDYTVSLNGATGTIEPVSQATGEPTVVTWADGICYVNRVPTFMMGFVRSDPEVLKDSPFNLCFPGELTQPEMSFLDKCAEYNLLTSVNLTATMRSLAPEAAASFARKYKDHPALFSYYLCDEPDHASPSIAVEPPILARAADVIRAIDCYHPTQTIVIPWCPSNIYRYRDVTDISGGDTYVVEGTPNNTNLWKVWRSSEMFRRSARNGEVNIFVPRAQSDITPEENWGQAYMCIVSGAGGIMWFEFDGAQNKWSDFVALGNELRSIEEFLVGMELVDGLAFANDAGQVRGIGRAAVEQDQTALITVNIKPYARSNVQITAPFLSHASVAEVLFESRTVPVSGGVIVDDFAGLERHVYVVDGIPDGVEMRPVPTPCGASECMEFLRYMANDWLKNGYYSFANLHEDAIINFNDYTSFASQWPDDCQFYTPLTLPAPLEDFESFSTTTELRTVWDPTGATETYYYIEPTYLHSGLRAVKISSYNYEEPYYCGISRTDAAEDYTLGGTGASLSLWFRGTPSIDEIYVKLTDTSDAEAVVKYSDAWDISDLEIEQWQQWTIDLQYFLDDNPVFDMVHVKTLEIGVGDCVSPRPVGAGPVFFDDIRVNR